MTFRDQIASDLAGIFTPAGPGEDSEIITVDEERLTAVVIRQGASEFVMVDSGGADTETFLVRKSEYPQPRPNDKIIFEKTEEWQVQPGFTLNSIAGIWSIPVISSRRLKG